MTVFLSVLLRLSVMGSLLAGLLLFLRIILKHRIHQAVFYYLWLLVLLRLCIPAGITVPLPGAGQVQEDSSLKEPVLQKKSTQADPVSADQTKDALHQDGEAAERNPDGKDGCRINYLKNIWKQPLFWMMVWASGVLACLGRHIGGYLRFSSAVRRSSWDVSLKDREAVKKAVKEIDGEAADITDIIKTMETVQGMGADMLRDFKLTGRVQLAVCPFVHTPVQLGLFRTVIVLPKGISDREVLRDILLHELYHRKRNDLLYKWWTMAAASLHWFNPLMVLIRREIGRACELSCDEAAMCGMEADRRRHYGETLLKLAAPSPMTSMLTASMSEEKKQLKERLEAIAKYQKKGFAAAIVSVLLVLVMGSCALIFAAGGSSTYFQKDGKKGSYGKQAADLNAGRGGQEDMDEYQGDGHSAVMQDYLPVLEGREQFYCVPAAADAQNTFIHISDNTKDAGEGRRRMDITSVPELFSPDSSTASIWRFTAVDLDRDGGEEIVLQIIDVAGDMGGYLILHQHMGTVYGYACSHKAFELLKSDGTFAFSDLPGMFSGIGRIQNFTEDGYAFEQLNSVKIEPDSGKVSYFKGEKTITEEEYDTAYAMQGQKPYAVWHEFNDAGMDEAVSERLTGEVSASQTESSVDTGLHGYSFPVRVSKKRVLTVELDGQSFGDTYFAVDKIEIFEKKKRIQTIETASLAVPQDYAWDGLFVNRGAAVGEPDIRDLNFDGAEDFGLLAVGTYPKNVPYTYFLWNEKKQQFDYGFTLFGGEGILKTDCKKERLVEYWHDTLGTYKNIYTYGPDGALECKNP